MDLICKVAMLKGIVFSFGNEKFVLDKVLHNELLNVQNIEIFRNLNCKIVFLLRDPEDSIRSMITTLNYSEEHAINYYLRRIKHLTNLHKALCDQYDTTVVTYDSLLSDTDSFLMRLTNFLNLSVPLSPKYQLHKTTGKKGIGDPGPNIFSGEVKTTSHPPHPNAKLSTSSSKKLYAAYDELLGRTVDSD